MGCTSRGAKVYIAILEDEARPVQVKLVNGSTEYAI